MASGEDDIIQTYFAPLADGAEGAYALQDDAACINIDPQNSCVTSMDTLVAGTHFFSDDPPKSIAKKALAVNLSDLAAKGADPKYYLLSLALPKGGGKTHDRWLRKFSLGLEEVQTIAGCHLVGGDTVATDGPVTITITAIGEVPGGQMVKRSGAQANDHIFVSGTIGDSALGLALLQEPECQERWSLSSDQCVFLKDRYLHPAARSALAEPLRQCATAAMDISDGLAGDLTKLLKASDRAGEILADQIPLSEAAKTALDVSPDLLHTILTGGDDYEILCTVPPAHKQEFLKAASKASIEITAIGRVSTGLNGLRVLAPEGEQLTIKPMGYKHF